MFDVYCPTHRATVLLPVSRIRAMHNTDRGIVVEMECYDGTAVAFVTGRGAGAPDPEKLPVPA
jgi:hypothetical protein